MRQTSLATAVPLTYREIINNILTQEIISSSNDVIKQSASTNRRQKRIQYR